VPLPRRPPPAPPAVDEDDVRRRGEGGPSAGDASNDSGGGGAGSRAATPLGKRSEHPRRTSADQREEPHPSSKRADVVPDPQLSETYFM